MRKFILILFIILSIFHLSIFSDGKPITIGIYQNLPLLGIDENNKPTGMFVELLNTIAAEEGWTINYKVDYFESGFDKVYSNDLDLMLAVGYTEERAEKFFFNEETIYSNWGQVYTNGRNEVNSFADLEGKTIGVEKGDVHYIGKNGIKNTLEAFNIHAYYVEYNEKLQMIEALNNNEIEAIVLSRTFGDYYESDYNMTLAPLQFNPIKLKIVTCNPQNKVFLDTIDQHISVMKEDGESVYYQQLDEMVGINQKEIVPKELKYTLLLLITALFTAMIAIGIYRRTIRKHENSIKEQNKHLKEIINHLTALNGITKMDELFKVLVNQLKDMIGINDLSVVSIVKHEDNYYVDESSFVEGNLKEYAGCLIDDSPINASFQCLLSKIDEGSLEIYFDDNKILVPYDSSYLTRGYLYIECEKCVEEKELFKLYMANILTNLKVIIYNIIRNNEQTQLFIALGEIIEKRDNSVANHVKRVSEGSRVLAKACGYDDEAIDNLIIASSVHDIGKINVPDNILNYPGKLSPEQFEIIKTHATDDFKIFDNVNDQLSKMVHDVVRHHHENWDGTGYPEGLKGEAIPHVARIVSVIDVFEALTHTRAYKNPWSYEEACQFVKEKSGEKFDPAIVSLFEKNSDEIMLIFRSFPDK